MILGFLYSYILQSKKKHSSITHCQKNYIFIQYIPSIPNHKLDIFPMMCLSNVFKHYKLKCCWSMICEGDYISLAKTME